jgi:hypothetical protein
MTISDRTFNKDHEIIYNIMIRLGLVGSGCTIKKSITKKGTIKYRFGMA